MACRIVLLAAVLLAAPLPVPAQQSDPAAEVFATELRPAVESLAADYRARRKYAVDDFPMAPAEFDAFRAEIVGTFVSALGLEQWQVRRPEGKRSPTGGLFEDRVVKRFNHAGVEMEAHVVELPTGDGVPMILCLPAGAGPHPAVAAFPGHGEHPLHDLVFGEDSYQKGMCARLARAGFASIAVEKVDSGYLSLDGRSGVDEKAVASFRLGMETPIRAVQLMATVAAVEILAAHPRVDETRIGATGVSLGGWLAIQTALLNDRIRAVAEYSTKTVFLGEAIAPDEFTGVQDICHVIPGMFELGDRNILLYPFAPRPLLSGHGGETDRNSHRQYDRYYKRVFEAQYEALGKPENFRYHIHQGGHSTEPETVIEFFRQYL